MRNSHNLYLSSCVLYTFITVHLQMAELSDESDELWQTGAQEGQQDLLRKPNLMRNMSTCQ